MPASGGITRGKVRIVRLMDLRQLVWVFMPKWLIMRGMREIEVCRLLLDWAYEDYGSGTDMSKATRWWNLVALLLAFLFLVSACGGGDALPTPAGQADGRPTLLYLWTFP